MKWSLVILFCIFLLAILLRIVKVPQVPRGLYVDEASVAYNAYDILTTGKDEHGVSHPFAFQAFGEYKMPVFIYMTSVSLAIFGKNEFAIRIPSVLFGILTVILFYFFAQELIRYEKGIDKKYYKVFALVATFLLAISPWHIQFSRAGFEAIVALCFFLIGLLLFLLYKRKEKIYLLLSSVLFLVASMYTYNAFRVIAPLSIVFVLSQLFFSSAKKSTVFLSGTIAFFLAFPMILFSFTHAGQARFSQVTAFSGEGVKASIFYPLVYLQNYLSYFSFSYFFSFGDTIGRHTVFRMGPVFKWEIIFLLAGVIFLIKEKWTVFKTWLLFLLLVSPTAAALALPSPHVLRSLPLVLPITLLVSFAIVILWQKMKKKYLFFGIVALIACFEFFLYLDLYYNYTVVALPDWGGQYKELATTLEKYNSNNTIFIIHDNVGMNPIYGKFYEPQLHFSTVGDSWTKPGSFAHKTVIFVTSAEAEQKNTYIHMYTHTLLNTITTPDRYHTTLYSIWKI